MSHTTFARAVMHATQVDIIRRSLAKYLPVVEKLAKGQVAAPMQWF